MEYESQKMTHIYNEEGNNKGGNHEPVNRFELKKKDVWIHGPPIWENF